MLKQICWVLIGELVSQGWGPGICTSTRHFINEWYEYALYNVVHSINEWYEYALYIVAQKPEAFRAQSEAAQTPEKGLRAGATWERHSLAARGQNPGNMVIWGLEGQQLPWTERAREGLQKYFLGSNCNSKPSHKIQNNLYSVWGPNTMHYSNLKQDTAPLNL